MHKQQVSWVHAVHACMALMNLAPMHVCALLCCALQCKGGATGKVGIVVQVVDTCATCSRTALNLHAAAFGQLSANPATGQIQVVYEQVG